MSIFLCPCCAIVRDISEEEAPCAQCGYAKGMGARERRFRRRQWRRRLGIPT